MKTSTYYKYMEQYNWRGNRIPNIIYCILFDPAHFDPIWSDPVWYDRSRAEPIMSPRCFPLLGSWWIQNRECSPFNFSCPSDQFYSSTLFCLHASNNASHLLGARRGTALCLGNITCTTNSMTDNNRIPTVYWTNTGLVLNHGRIPNGGGYYWWWLRATTIA